MYIYTHIHIYIYIYIYIYINRKGNIKNDADFSVDFDDYYLTENNTELVFSEGVRASACVSMSIVMISGNSMREIIRSLIFSKIKYLIRSITGVKVNAKIEIL